MMQKTYTIENLGCANCAAKMEAKMNALPQVQEAVITFTTRQLRITAEAPDALLPQLQQIVSSIEADAKITEHTEGILYHVDLRLSVIDYLNSELGDVISKLARPEYRLKIKSKSSYLKP